MVVDDKPWQVDALRGFNTAASPIIEVYQYGYRVDYGAKATPQYHYISKKRFCHCPLGAECPAVQAVANYLRGGGQRAPDYPETYWPTVPNQCPVCGAACEAHARYDFPTHGTGWRCLAGGTVHFWEALAQPLIRLANAGRSPFVLEPVWDAAGNLMYPGVTHEEMDRAKTEAQLTNQAWAAQGYSPGE
jgi:hypothetical protein